MKAKNDSHYLFPTYANLNLKIVCGWVDKLEGEIIDKYSQLYIPDTNYLTIWAHIIAKNYFLR